MVGLGLGRSAGLHLQLESRGDVEEAAESWLEVKCTGRAWAIQGEGLQHGSDQEEELGLGQALPEADSLSWGGGEGVPLKLNPLHRKAYRVGVWGQGRSHSKDPH